MWAHGQEEDRGSGRQASQGIRAAARKSSLARPFAVAAAIVIVLSTLTILPKAASAIPPSPPNADAASGGTMNAASVFVVRQPDGATAAESLPMFQRWDGAWLPDNSLNRRTGDWPYLANDTASDVSVTRLGQSFHQAKVPGAWYDLSPWEIKETLVYPFVASSPILVTAFTTTYSVKIQGVSVTLQDSHGNVAWQTAPFAAWDSADPARRWDHPILSLTYGNGVLTMTLDASMLAQATLPLYVDPTWVLKANANNVWSGTFDHVTSDWGDMNLRIGYLADNFNDNKNEIWTVTSGNSFSLSGGRAQLTATEIHATGTWSNLTLGSTLNFASCGASNLLFRYSTSSNYYYLNVNFAGKQVTLYKVISGVTTALSTALSISMVANTDYDAKVVARGNYFEIWWIGARKWSGTDPSPPGSPLSGNVGLSETTSRCTVSLDNVRVRDTLRASGNYTSIKRGAASGNVATQLRFLGQADAYNATDLWINSSSDNSTWAGWHLVKTMAAPGFYYPIPDVDQKQYYQVRASLRTGLDGTSSAQEIDVSENPPPSGIVAKTNTGHEPWYLYVGGDVNAVSGNLVLSSTDLAISAKGFPIAIVRTYNSLLAGTAGPFGLGTMDEFHAKLAFPTGGNVTLTAGDGATYTFATLGGSGYSPPAGVHDNLVKNADGTYALWQPDGSRMNFDGTGKLTTIVDRNGNHLTVTYTSGNPTRIADDSGLGLTLGYDTSNRVKNITDPAGRKVTYAYNSSGRLIQVADPMGFTENYTFYDTLNRLLVRVDRAGHVDRFVYDASGRVNETWIGEWNFVSVPGSIRWQVRQYRIAYVSGTQTTATNAAGAVTTATFNSQGNPTSIVGPSVGCGLCSGGNSTSYTWDGEFDPLTVIDGRGDATTYSYDWMGNALTSKDPGGNVTVRTFLNVQNATQFLSVPATVTTPKGYTTRATYYASGNLYSTANPDGNVSRRFYDSAGSPTRLQDFRGNSVTIGYDSHEFLVNTTDAGGNRTTYQNDAIGRAWNVTSPGGNTTRSVYDADGRVTSTTDPMGNTTTNGFDRGGRTIKVTDANTLVTTSAYNLTFGGLQKSVSPGGNTTQYVYDPVGNRLQVIDANNHVTRYAYDTFRRIANQTTPLGFVTKYVYDAAGNVVAEIEANGSRIGYTYDKSNRVFQTAYQTGAPETVAYDADGNVIEKKAFELDELFAYDALDRVIQAKQVFLDASLVVWHNYTYDANGNRRSMDGSGGGTYVWDGNNRIFSETDSVGNRWTFAHGKDGQLLRETYPDGEYVTYVYDRDGRVTLKSSFQASGSLLERLGYAYDKVGNVVTEQTPQVTEAASAWQYASCCSAVTSGLTASGLSPSPQTVTVSVYARGFATDNINMPPNCASPTVTWYYLLNGNTIQLGSQTLNLNKRLGCYSFFGATFSASVSVHNGDILQGEVVFQNDSVVTTSISGMSVSFQGATFATTYVYDKEYRLYRATYPNGSSTQYTYDAVGNRLTYLAGGTTVTSSYNADSELTSSSDGTTYGYDANGNLVSRTGGSVTTHYSYDYANNLAPVSTTMLISSTCGCPTTPTATLPTLLPSPQSNTITVSSSGTLEDDIDYPNCPTVTVTWYYVLNGIQYQVGSKAVTLHANQLGFCITGFSGTYSSPQPVALHTGDRLAGKVSVDSGGASVGATYSSTSVNAGTFNVAPYVVMQYGPDGLRSSERMNQGSVTQHFGYDLLGMDGLPQRVADFSGTSLSTSYFYGVGSDRPLDIIQGSASYYYHRDDLGSTTTITNGSGNVAASYRYDAYGNLQQAADTIGNPLQYAGAPRDATTGLIDDRARFYDPATGRFLTPDPLGGGYAYVGDNPVNRVDPSGRAALSSHLIEGGDGGQGCTMTMYKAGLCVFQLGDIGGGGGGRGGGGATGPVWTNKCTLGVFIFAVLLGFSLLGVALGSTVGVQFAYRALAVWTWGIGASLLSGSLGGFAGTIFSIFWWVLWNLFLPSLGWFDAIETAVMIGGRLNPVGVALLLIQIAIQLIIFLVGLKLANCI